MTDTGTQILVGIVFGLTLFLLVVVVLLLIFDRNGPRK